MLVADDYHLEASGPEHRALVVTAPRYFPLHCRPRGMDNHSFISAVAPVAVGREVRDVATWFPVLPAVECEDPLKIIRYVIATRDLKDFRFADRTGKAFWEGG